MNTAAATLDDDRLSETFAALASATRRAILATLMQGAATVNDIAEPFDLTLPAISKHIKVLERAGLITRGRQAQFRPCAIDAAPLLEVAAWAEQYRPIWEGRFDRMSEYLERLQSDPEHHGHQQHPPHPATKTPVTDTPATDTPMNTNEDQHEK